MAGMHHTTGRALDGMDHLRQSITDILTTPVMRWEPRVRLTRVQLTSGPAAGQATLDLAGEYLPTRQPMGLQLALQMRAAV